MQNAPNNIILCHKRSLLVFILLFTAIPCLAQNKTDTNRKQAYLAPEHSRLVVLPHKYLVSPQVDVMMGTSRVNKQDRSGVGYSATARGVYQLGNYWHINAGLGFTMLNSRRVVADGSLPDTPHFANILHAPIGLSFIIGDDRSQVFTTLDLLPAYNAGTSLTSSAQRTLTWGVSTEFGFLLRVRRHWHTGLTGKLQVFKPFDRNIHVALPQYGFAGVGIMVRFSY